LITCFKENTEQQLSLVENDVDTVDLFVQWIYNNEMSCSFLGEDRLMQMVS